MNIRRRSTIAVLLALAVPIGMSAVARACAPSSWGWTPPATPEQTAVAGQPSSADATQAAAPAPAADASTAAVQVTEQPTPPVQAAHPSARPVAKTAPTHAAPPVRSHVGQPTSNAGPSQATRPVAPVVAGTPVVAPVAQSHPSAPARHARVLSRHHVQSPAAKAQPRASASDDLAQGWNAPASERPNGLLAADSSSDWVSSTGADSTLIFGAGLLGLGLAALVGGFTIAGTRRRRVGASAQKHR